MERQRRAWNDAPDLIQDVEVSKHGEEIAVVALLGQHDLRSSEQVEALLTNLVADNKLVVIDVSKAEFIDSSLLHNLVKAERRARTEGHRFVLQLGTAPVVKRTLEVSGLLNELDCTSSLEEALARSRPAD